MASAFRTEWKKKTGVLVLNFGGPNDLQEVKPFLYRLFSDKRILVGMPAPFRQALAFMISRLKGRGSVEAYRQIGGRSPQLKWTETQVEQLQRLVDDEEGSIRVELGMRVWGPSIQEAIWNLRAWGAEELILLPMFPQYSTTTTESCFDAVFKELKSLKWNVPIHKILNWADNRGYVELLKSYLDTSLKRMKEESSDPVYVLFSAHSLPIKVIERGDPYLEDVQKTVNEVSLGLEETWSLAFQSRNGPVPWVKPYFDEELKRLAREGWKRVLVVPISFVSDHIETLYELDLEYGELAEKVGITDYQRTPMFNDDPRFPKALAGIIEAQL